MHDTTKSSPVKKVLGLGAVMLTLSFMACLTAPNEPATNPVSCGGSLQLWNGVCRLSCKTTTDCNGGLRCMAVGAGTSLCLDYTSCAYLQSDSTCDQSGSGTAYGYGAYQQDPYWTVSPAYGAELSSYSQGASCAGNGVWLAVPPSGDPECGQSHAVNRCRPTAGGCTLVPGNTLDIAEP
jgi:hypothetical protein